MTRKTRSLPTDYASAVTDTTRNLYKRDLDKFWAWAFGTGAMRRTQYPIAAPVLMAYVKAQLGGLPKATIRKMAAYGVEVTGRPLRVGSLRRHLAAISVEHSLRDLKNPTREYGISLLLRRAAKLERRAADRRHRPITADILKDLLAACGKDLRGKRDRALLLVGFGGGGRRRSELARLMVEDLSPVEGGYLATLSHHKTKRVTREGLTFPILGSAAKALDAWLEASGIESGLIFQGVHRSGRLLGTTGERTVNRIVKYLAKKAGYDPDLFGAHSLRSGFMTQAAREGISLPEAMAVSGHRSLLVAYRYYRAGTVLDNRAARLTVIQG